MNYVEIRFKLPREDFDLYEEERQELGLKSATVLIKAAVQKQAHIKRQLKQLERTNVR